MLVAVWLTAMVVWLGASVRVVVHAFGRSVGTGVIVLCIPCYVYVYAFSQFEHPKKGWWVSGLCAGALLFAVLGAAVVTSLAPVSP